MPTSVPFSALLPPKGNPRGSYDKRSIEGLAQSIKKDGVIQNLLVRPEGEGTYRVIAGKRRYLALQHLSRKGEIDRAYKVPIRIRAKATQQDLDRLATVENVQREALDPIDEAEAFAKLLRKGEKIDAVAAETGVSATTIRRRLALADLAPEVKTGVREKSLALALAEVLTLAAPDQQKRWLKDLRSNRHLDARSLRLMLLEEKPSVAMALFPPEAYAGTVTRDLFADKESTYFDDREQFLKLQAEAVERLAAEHRQRFAWVEVVSEPAAPWWQYREARKKEKGGVLIHFAPTGRVEIRKNLVRHPVEAETVAAAGEAKRREKPEWTRPTLRYANAQLTVALQRALLDDPRKAREVAATLLLTAAGGGANIRLQSHDALRALAKAPQSSKAYQALEELAGNLSRALNLAARPNQNEMPAWGRLLHGGVGWPDALSGARALADRDLDMLILLCVLLCFGVAAMERPEIGGSPFAMLAGDLALDVRSVWTPDAMFLGGLRREQLIRVAQEAGAERRFPRLQTLSKQELVDGLVRHFERVSDPAATLDATEARGKVWLPACMRLGVEAAA